MEHQVQTLVDAHITLPAVSEQWKASFSNWLNFHYQFSHHSNSI